jgi:ketosteroid isomerase-like protein
MYGGLMEKAAMNVHFSTAEVVIAGDLAYERGTYTLRVTDKASGLTLQDVKNKHVHIMRRQPDGSWKTWRMMVNSAGPALASK